MKIRIFEAEAKMTKTSFRAWVPKTVIVVSITLVFGLSDVRQSFAACGGYCEARQVRAICHRAVAIQGLKARERDAEFEKCKANRMTYLSIEEVTDLEDIGLE
jgi:hypothetical protein